MTETHLTSHVAAFEPTIVSSRSDRAADGGPRDHFVARGIMSAVRILETNAIARFGLARGLSAAYTGNHLTAK